MKNNILKKSILLSSLTLGIGLAGCSQRIGDFTVISTKNTEIGASYVRSTLDDKKSVGIDSKPIIVIIPMGTPSIKDAVDRALENSGSQVLTDVVVYYDYFYIPYVYGEFKYRVEGTGWKRTTDLNKHLQQDLSSAKELYVAKEINGKTEFVKVPTSDPIIKTVK